MSRFTRFLGGNDDDDVDLDKFIDSSDGKDTSVDDEWIYEIDEMDTVRTNNKEILSNGYRSDDDVQEEMDAFAGEWPRKIIESRLSRPEDLTWLGYSDAGVEGLRPEGIEFNSLFHHTAIFGQTGYGKSTLLKNMMVQWIMSGYGVCFFDQHGQDAKELVQMIPPERLDDVVWIEPGGDHDREVGFNFFEPSAERGTSAFRRQVRKIKSDFIEMLGIDEGARMEAITEGVVRQLAQHERNFTPIEFYRVLNDEDEREFFAENFGDSFDKPFLQQVSNTDQDDLSPIIRRVREWVEDEHSRQIIARRESTVHINEAIEQGKILIVNFDNVEDDDLIRTISNTIIRRMWSTIKQRSNIPERNRTPYFLVMDEFASIEHENMQIDDILPQARKFKLAVTLCTQQPSQLQNDSVVQEIKNQCKNFFTFRVGSANTREAKRLADALGPRVNGDNLLSLREYTLVGKIHNTQKDTSKTVPIKTFAPYPPIRTEKEAEEEIQRSLERYGAPVEYGEDDEMKFEDYSLIKQLSESNIEEGDDLEDEIVIESEETTVTAAQLYEAIYTAGIRYDTKEINDIDRWVKHSDFVNEIEKYFNYNEETPEKSELGNVTEKIPDDHIKREFTEGHLYLRLTAEGQKEGFIQDTGSAGSGGGAEHRLLIRKGYETLTKLGYRVRRPKQTGKADPDGIGLLPIDPMEESAGMEELEKLKAKLHQEYTQLTELFGIKEIAIESETSTWRTPARTLTNLKKARNENRHCVFLAPDGNWVADDDKERDIDEVAQKIENLICNPPGVKRLTDEYRYFYNNSNKIKLKDGSVPVYKKENQGGGLEWRKDLSSGRIFVRPGGKERAIASFRNTTELRNPSKTKFDYHRYKDSGSGLWIVADEKGNIINEYDTKKEMKKDWSPVTRPFIPEQEFPEGKVPDRSTWDIIVFPDSSRDEYNSPQLYREGELTPIFNEIDNPKMESDPLPNNDGNATLEAYDREDIDEEIELEDLDEDEKNQSKDDLNTDEEVSADNENELEKTNSTEEKDSEDDKEDKGESDESEDEDIFDSLLDSPDRPSSSR